MQLLKSFLHPGRIFRADPGWGRCATSHPHSATKTSEQSCERLRFSKTLAVEKSCHAEAVFYHAGEGIVKYAVEARASQCCPVRLLCHSRRNASRRRSA
jgi:hypothetical protein